MKRMPALAAAAVVALATLSGCGSDKTTTPATSAASAATSAASSAMSAASSATDASSATTSSTEASSASTTASDPSSSASEASSAATPAAQAPAGYHMVTSPGQKVTFAVPDSWIVPSGKLLQQPQVAAAVKDSDIVVISTKPRNHFAANVNVIKPSSNDPRLASKEEIAEQLAKIGGTVTSYDQIQTQLGEGTKIGYSVTDSEESHKSVALEVPNGHDEFLVITVSASTADEAEQAAKVIISTVKAA